MWFRSTAEGNLLSEDDQWAKLELVVETVRVLWRSRVFCVKLTYFVCNDSM